MAAAKFWGARPSRVLAKASRLRGLPKNQSSSSRDAIPHMRDGTPIRLRSGQAVCSPIQNPCYPCPQWLRTALQVGVLPVAP